MRNRRDSDKLQPVRKIKPNAVSITGYYPFRGERSIPFESTLERDFLIRTDFSLSVLDVIAQPVAVPFVGQNGQIFNYTPDFLVYFRLGYRDYPLTVKPLLIEVKPEEQWRKHWREWLRKWKAANRYAESQGWSFRIHDENRIRDQMFQNIQFLARYERMAFPGDELMETLGLIALQGSCAIRDLLPSDLTEIERRRKIALYWHLLALRQIDCDMSLPLDEDVEVWVVERG